MIDPRSEAVLILKHETGQFEDETRKVSRYKIHAASRKIEIVFNSSDPIFSYWQARVRILRHPERVALAGGARVEVRGNIWESATEILTFSGPNGAWTRIFYRRKAGEALFP